MDKNFHKVIGSGYELPAEPEFQKSLDVSLDDYGQWIVVATEEKDMDGDILRIDGIDFSKYHRPQSGIRLQIIPNHLKVIPDGSPPTIGRVEEFRKSYVKGLDGTTVKALLARFTWAKSVDGIADLAGKWKQLYPDYINCFSPGFMSLTSSLKSLRSQGGRYDITKSILYEISACAIPANPSATAVSEIKKTLGGFSDILEVPEEGAIAPQNTTEDISGDILKDAEGLSEEITKTISEVVTEPVEVVTEPVEEPVKDAGTTYDPALSVEEHLTKALADRVDPVFVKLEKKFESLMERLDYLESVLVVNSAAAAPSNDHKKAVTESKKIAIVKMLKELNSFTGK